jgi:UDP-N-acetyl-D-glucosamine/UDP-N-acetyl-D-galactosamine dehydrogenase
MSFKSDLLDRTIKLSVIGLGYVGMPIALAFAKKIPVVGYDVNSDKISLYKKGMDPTNEVGNDALKNTNVYFTDDETKLRDAKFHIVAVPTPINQDKTPDLAPVVNASKTIGRNLIKGSIVVYESTVYPGVTEDVCARILEKESGLICGQDFWIGYSPERINPGDKTHRLNNIKKIVSGMDSYSLENIAEVYELVVEAGVHRAPTIKTAEAAKVVENSQRDINIAFMNELAMVFDRMDIDTTAVIEAMNTKWNALGFTPGLVGGHCIGVDPYYFVYEAEKLGYHSQIILSGRKVNDGMGEFIAQIIIKQLILSGKKVKDSKVMVMGITFKENCPDVRNTKVFDIIKHLKEVGIDPLLTDPIANPSEVKKEYNVDLLPFDDIHDVDCIVLAVAHDEYKTLNNDDITKKFKTIPNNEKVIVDVKGIFDREYYINQEYLFWRL